MYFQYCACVQRQAGGQQRDDESNGSLSHPLGIVATLIGECGRLNNGPPNLQVVISGACMWHVSVELW